MKNLKNLLVALCIGLLIFTTACDKTIESAPVTLLTKMTTTHTDGTQDIVSLEYDSQNNLIKYIIYLRDTIPHENQITYNSDGKLSQILLFTMGIELKSTFTWTDNSITQVYWNENENNVWVENGEKLVFDIGSDNLISKDQIFYMQNDVLGSFGYKLYTWSNGNLEKCESWNITNRKTNELSPINTKHTTNLSGSSLSTVNDSKYSTSTYEYDSKNNAFLGINFVGIGKSPVSFECSSKNNVTKETLTNDFALNSIETYTYAYEYNDNNYPSKRTTTHENWNGVETDITIYEYTTK